MGKENHLSKVLKISQIGLIATIVAIIIVVSFMSPFFLRARNLSNLVRSIAVLGVVSIGQTLIILTGEIDISVGANLSVSAVIATTCAKLGYGTFFSTLVGLLVGCIIGFVNGMIVVKARINSLVVTIASMSILTGISLLVSGGAPILGVPKSLQTIGQGNLMSYIPIQFLIMVILAFIIAFILHNTVLGRYIYATGDDINSSNLEGIPTGKIKIIVFAVAGLLCAVGGILRAGQQATADPLAGENINLMSIASVVIGGTSLTGGVGGIFGTMLGTILMGLIQNAMVMLHLFSYWQSITIGVAILIAVIWDSIKKKEMKNR